MMKSWRSWCSLNQYKKLYVTFLNPLISEQDYIDLLAICLKNDSRDCLKVILKSSFHVYQRPAWAELVLHNDVRLIDEFLPLLSFRNFTACVRKGLSLSAKQHNKVMFDYLLGHLSNDKQLIQQALKRWEKDPHPKSYDSMELSDGPFIIRDAFKNRWDEQVIQLLKQSLTWDSQTNGVEYDQVIRGCQSEEDLRAFLSLFKQAVPSEHFHVLHDRGPRLPCPRFDWVMVAVDVLGEAFVDSFWPSYASKRYGVRLTPEALSDPEQMFHALICLQKSPHFSFFLHQALKKTGPSLLFDLARTSVHSDFRPGLFTQELIECMSIEDVHQGFALHQKEFGYLLDECGQDPLFFRLNSMYEKWSMEQQVDVSSLPSMRSRKI